MFGLFFVTLQVFTLRMKIYKLNNISELKQDTAATVGMFDGVHIGHQHIIALLRQESERLNLTPVVVTFAQHPRQVLGGGVGGVGVDRFCRITTNAERYAILEHFGIHHVLELDFTRQTASLTACRFFEQILVGRLRVKALVLGYDNMFGSKEHNDFDQLPALAQSRGVSVKVDTAVRFGGIDVSSTQVRKALRRGDVSFAADLLGYDYLLWGRVTKGRQMGRRLGFPTANVCLDDTTKVMPADGVYAVRIYLEGSTEPRIGMANFGGQPTFGLDKPVFEVNIFDFDGDLYDTTLRVEFVAHLRQVQKFGSIAELVCQLNADREEARRSLEARCGRGTFVQEQKQLDDGRE